MLQFLAVLGYATLPVRRSGRGTLSGRHSAHMAARTSPLSRRRHHRLTTVVVRACGRIVLASMLVAGLAACDLLLFLRPPAKPSPPTWIQGAWHDTTGQPYYCSEGSPGYPAYRFSSDEIGKGVSVDGVYQECSVTEQFDNNKCYDESTSTTYHIHLFSGGFTLDGKYLSSHWDLLYTKVDDLTMTQTYVTDAPSTYTSTYTRCQLQP